MILQADTVGARAGALASYDPFGQPIDPTIGQIGATAADDAVPDTIGGSDADYAWAGGNRQEVRYGLHTRMFRRTYDDVVR